ncbi:protein translocase subunit SecD-like [Equus przewalskii]|uniref:Protein translocase subunit SecD-like n=1 Tax=Equus przewalskii TaxID=9798 RepID=A0ABM4M2Y4_EQUPR
MVGLIRRGPGCSRARHNTKRRRERAPPSADRWHETQGSQPARTLDPAPDRGPPPARGASGTFASPSPPRPRPPSAVRRAQPRPAAPGPAPPAAPRSNAQLSRAKRQFAKSNASSSPPRQLHVLNFDPVCAGCAVAAWNRRPPYLNPTPEITY